jgi:ubiquinol-cytochrome c reductase cytochrome b subunit
MRIKKKHPLMSLLNGYLVDSPQPSNISYLRNYRSLLGFLFRYTNS